MKPLNKSIPIIGGLIAGGLIILVIFSTNRVQTENPLSPFNPDVTPASPAASDNPEKSALLYVVALEGSDAVTSARPGTIIGCNDALASIAVSLAGDNTQNQIRNAVQQLLELDKDVQNDSGHVYYNALAQSDLRVETVRVSGNQAEIMLTGDVSLGGTCDTPRLMEQLRTTVEQFPGIDKANFFINGETMEEALSLQ